MTRGTLTNGTVEIKGAFNRENPGDISFTPEGAKYAVHFVASEWAFVPDKKPLPLDCIITAQGWLPMLKLGETVYQVTYEGEMLLATDLGYDPLERLKDKGSRIFKSVGTELNKEDYA